MPDPDDADKRTGFPVQPAQQTAARISGAILLLAMAASMLAELVGLGGVALSNDAAATARTLQASQAMVRIAAVTHLLCFLGDIVLAAAFYVVFRPVNRGAALLGALLRTADAAVLAMSTLTLFAALRLVSPAPYLQAFTPAQLQSGARLLFALRGDAMSLGWVFLGLGQAVFAWLWLKSRYVPRLLAWGGLVASLLLGVTPLLVMLAPSLRQTLGMSYMAPMFFYEVTLGIWLLARGLRTQAA